jgi:hypothetical protein
MEIKDIEKMIPQNAVAEKLNHAVSTVLTADGFSGFQKAYLIATAAGELKKLLTAEYMKPIMDLQGNKLGFKTDKDISQGGGKGPGYPEDVVKNCLIEAVLTGVQPFGNQFNIIAGNCYITKEGFGYLLANFPGLSYEIIPTLPRINGDKTSAAIIMKVKWVLNGIEKERELEIPVKMNAYMGTDAVIGKATRKARAWLFNTITGSEIPEGDAMDASAEVVGSKINDPVTTIEELQTLFDFKKAMLTKEEQESAQRIIDNKETASYSKLFKLLNSK